jgi:hypothetical protein
MERKMPRENVCHEVTLEDYREKSKGKMALPVEA